MKVIDETLLLCIYATIHSTRSFTKHRSSISTSRTMRGCCEESLRIMRIATMSWHFKSQPMRKVNLNPQKILTNSAIIATEMGMTRARVFRRIHHTIKFYGILNKSQWSIMSCNLHCPDNFIRCYS